MIDREKVIKGIQECNLNGGLIGNCPYKGILALLKEKEEQIRKLTEELEELRNKRNEVYYSGYDGSFIL